MTLEIQALEQRITIRSNERRKQLQLEHPGQFVPNFAITEDEQIQHMQTEIGKLQEEVRQIIRDKEREAGLGPSRMDDTLGICQKIAKMSVAGFNDVAKLIILVSTSAALQLVILLASNLFNEMTVTSALYQFGLILFPEVTNWVYKVDFSALYLQELKFAQTQTRKGLYMIPFVIASIGLIVVCAKGYYELNDLSLLIPALKFKDEFIRSMSRATYLSLFFLVQVISVPVLEQRFYFVYISGMLSQLTGLRELIPLIEFDRKSVLNSGAVLALHSLTYVTYIYKNFSDYNMQLYAVASITAIAVLSIHILRLRYGIIASIIGHMLFNLSVFLILATIYTTDFMHEGFTAEEFTTKNNNCIDFIFGHNEGVENNLA